MENRLHKNSRMTWKLGSGVPNLGTPFGGEPLVKTAVFGCLYWGPPINGNCYLGLRVGGLSRLKLRL